MNSLKYIKQALQKEYAGEKGSPDYNYKALYTERLIEFRKPKDVIVPVDYPTNLARARELGYKAKQGIILARIRIRKGVGLHHRPVRARRPKRMGHLRLSRKMSIQGIAEQRVQRKFPNMEVLNSYWVGEDGKNKYYEVILVDPSSPVIQSDKNFRWLVEGTHQKRALRGLTSGQKKSRGLTVKGIGAEKVRPSLRAHDRTGN